MTEPYTPTDDRVRNLLHVYADHLAPGEADRLLAERDRQAKVEALREAAEAGWDDVSGVASAPLLAPAVADWLHERADRIEAGDTDE